MRPGGVQGLAGLGQAEWWHVVVDGLVLSCCDQIGLVPDPNVAVRAYLLVELDPVRVVDPVAIARVGREVRRRAPVLNQHANPSVWWPRKPELGLASSSLTILGIVLANQRCSGNFHQRLIRAPIRKTTKSPSMWAV